ncbi:MAG: DUF983 domain-containing protein [Alphaproteobacteria bacterium]|nr:DUF983 domain-containing protein [Alphaproteobacteria bacterium]
MTEPSPFLAGLRGRCPRCGEGRLFSGYLKIADTCEACGLDFRGEDAGDGPAVFIMFAVGFIVVPLALVAEVAFSPPLWLHMVLWIPVSLALILIMLPPFKATLYALQYKHAAHEGRLDEPDDDQG